MTPQLSIRPQVDTYGRHLTLVVTGTLTDANQHVLPSLVAQTRTAFPHARLTVDLHQTELHGTTAIKVLTRNLQNRTLGTASVRIAGVGPRVRLMLELTGRHRALTRFDSARAAFPDN